MRLFFRKFLKKKFRDVFFFVTLFKLVLYSMSFSFAKDNTPPHKSLQIAVFLCRHVATLDGMHEYLDKLHNQPLYVECDAGVIAVR